MIDRVDDTISDAMRRAGKSIVLRMERPNDGDTSETFSADGMNALGKTMFLFLCTGVLKQWQNESAPQAVTVRIELTFDDDGGDDVHGDVVVMVEK